MTTLYRFFGTDGTLLYIGVAGNPGRRFGQHEKYKEWWTQVVRSTMEHFDSRLEALEAEVIAIRTEAPVFNVVHNREKIRVKRKWRSVVTVCRGGIVLGKDCTTDERIKDFDHTLLFYMAKRMDRRNLLRKTQREMAADFKTRKARISESIGRLREAGYISTDGGYGILRINPEYYWRTSLVENEKQVLR